MAGAFQSNRSNVPDVMPPVVNPYDTAVLADSPLAYYKLNEPAGTSGSGSVLDSSGNGRHMTPSGALTFGAASVPGTSGGTSVEFTGTANIEYALPIIDNLTMWTIEAWARSSATAILDGRPFYCERAMTGNDIIKMDSFSTSSSRNNRTFATIRNDAGTLTQYSPSAANMRDGNWHQTVITRLGTLLTLYQDGISVGSTTIAGGTWSNSGRVSRIGSDVAAAATAQFLGNICSVSVYGTALTSTRVTAHYAAR